MVLFQMIIEVAVCAMSDTFSQFSLNGSGVGVVPIGRDLDWYSLGDGSGGPEEGLSGGAVVCLTWYTSTRFPSRSIPR